MPKCPNCGQKTEITKDFACQWCGYPLMSKGYHWEAIIYLLVIAAAFGSPLAKGLGLGKVGDFVIGAQTEVATTTLDEIEVFFAWLVPTSPPKALLGLLSRRSPGLYLRKLISSLLAEGKTVSAEDKLCYRGISLKPLAKTYIDRVVVVGDAAGQIKPTTGGGIYHDLLCAEIAANNLQQALESGDLSARRLANYQREW